MAMHIRNLYSIFAGILPPLLGLGLIEIYVERDLSITIIATSMMALALLMILVAALVDVAGAGAIKASRQGRRRSRG
jgi:hypothetical protein